MSKRQRIKDLEFALSTADRRYASVQGELSEIHRTAFNNSETLRVQKDKILSLTRENEEFIEILKNVVNATAYVHDSALACLQEHGYIQPVT